MAGQAYTLPYGIKQTQASSTRASKLWRKKDLTKELMRVRPDDWSGLHIALQCQTNASVLNTCFKAIKKTDLSKELTRVILDSRAIFYDGYSGLHIALRCQTNASVLDTCFQAMKETDLTKELMRVRPDSFSGLHTALRYQTNASVLDTCFNAIKTTDLTKELTRVILDSWTTLYTGWSGLHLALCYQTDASVLDTCFKAMKKTDLTKELTRVILDSWPSLHNGWSGLHLLLHYQTNANVLNTCLKAMEKKTLTLDSILNIPNSQLNLWSINEIKKLFDGLPTLQVLNIKGNKLSKEQEKEWGAFFTKKMKDANSEFHTLKVDKVSFKRLKKECKKCSIPSEEKEKGNEKQALNGFSFWSISSKEKTGPRNPKDLYIGKDIANIIDTYRINISVTGS